MEARVPLHHGALEIADEPARLLDGRIVARNHDHRHSKLTSDRRVDSRFQGRSVVQAHVGKRGTRHRVSPDAGRIGGPGVVPDEDDRVKRLIDPLHHAQWPRPGPNDGDIGWKHFDEQILAIAVGVAHHDLRGPLRFRRVDGRQDLTRHELAEPAVLESGRA